MRVPAALHRWAAEHNQHLSAATRSEVDVIASIVEASSLREQNIRQLDDEFRSALRDIFPGERAERAETLINIVAEWAIEQPAESPRTTVAEVSSTPPSAAATIITPNPQTVGAAPSASPAPGVAQSAAASELGAPAFLRSDKVDEDDSARLYGSARSYIRPVLAVLSVLLLAAVGVGVWLWASSETPDPAETVDTIDGVPVTDDGTPTEPVGVEEAPTPLPTSTPQPELSAERAAWADTTTILNAGSGAIISSTYPVSAANRAVLTGHTAAITGIAISDDGRVLTSGADRRLVDWGSDVTLASPDVLDVETPLTVLIRTVDQKVVAGDANGNITVIDLINTAEPQVVAVHPAAISAADELADGRLAIASVDGDVAVLSLQAPGDALSLPHDTEVTAVVGLADGTIATASVDGSVRVWPATGGAPAVTISTLGAPVTAMHLLSDGQLATASVDGRIHVVPVVNEAEPTLVIDAHESAVRALWEFTDEANGLSLASGSDDSTIRLFSLANGRLWQQLDGHGDLVSALSQLPDGRLVSTSGDGTGRVWDLTLAGGAIVQPPHEWNLSHIAAWRNDQFVTGGVDGLVMLASTSETTAPEQITRHDAPVVGLTVMPNGDIVSLDANSSMRLIQLGPDAGEPFEILVAAGATALDNRGGLGVVTGHTDGTLHFSDFTADVGSVQVHGGGVTDVLGLSTGLVASASDDNTVRIVDLENPEQIPVFDLHTSPVHALAELPDGRIASASTDGIYVWSVDDMGAEHIRLNGHQLPVLTLLGLPDGRLLSTAADGRVRIWDLQNPSAEPTTLLDIPGIVNPELAQAGNGLFVAGAGRGYVVFAIE